ncbi:MAG TPA: ester cyclase [Terriglobia bacterium]|nr:ester cyclase [Terriglobia bacterium]
MADAPAPADAVLRAWFNDLWNEGKEDTIDRLFAADGVAHGLSENGAPVQGREAFRPFFKTFKSAFPDIRIEVVRTVCAGDMGSALCHVTGTHHGHDLGMPATGQPVDFWGMCMARVRDGQIVEGWNSFDFLSLYRQIGAISLPQQRS